MTPGCNFRVVLGDSWDICPEDHVAKSVFVHEVLEHFVGTSATFPRIGFNSAPKFNMVQSSAGAGVRQDY